MQLNFQEVTLSFLYLTPGILINFGEVAVCTTHCEYVAGSTLADDSPHSLELTRSILTQSPVSMVMGQE